MHITKWTAIALLAAAPLVYANDAEESVPRIEIREYRFQAHRNHGYERLVLEFTRKDGNTKVQPKVRMNGSEIVVDRAILMGAIPESLINDSYSSKSRFLGPLSVNTDSNTTGFALRAGLKNSRTTLKAFWLANPPRLVIDANSRGHVASDESEESARGKEGVTISHKKPQPPAFDKFICFPAGAQVGMNVSFQPHNNRDQELKNVRVNLASVTGEEAPPAAADAIVCYPKSAQVTAQLAFEVPSPKAAPAEATEGTTESAPIPQAKPLTGNTAPAGGHEDADMTLDPGAGSSIRHPATAPKPSVIPPPPVAMPAETTKPASPASLLPPLK